MALEFVRKRGGVRWGGDRTLERIFELAPSSWSKRLIEYSDTLYESDRPVVLAKLVRKVAPKQRRTLIASIFKKLIEARSWSNSRNEVVRELERYLIKLPKSVVLSTWGTCLERSSEMGREEVFVDVCGFAPILVHHFGHEVAQKLADAIAIGGTRHWP